MKKERPIFRRADESPDDAIHSPAPGQRVPILLLLVATLGLAYEAILLFTSFLAPYRFPIPYAVPIFDTPFVLVATGIGYLCLERHRMRQDFQSAAIGMSLWVAALLAAGHILTQPDYPGTPSLDPGVAPYLFFASYLAALTGVGLGAHFADRQLPLTDRGRWTIVAGCIAVCTVMALVVLLVHPLLPSLVMQPGRLTPFAVWTGGVLNGVVAVWALWSWRRRLRASGSQQGFVNLLALAAFIWVLGLIGFLLFPYRYAVSWYLAGVARPIGVLVIFVALLREQVWLYSEARARVRDLGQLNQAGQALVTSLDASEIIRTIAAKGLTIMRADASILFRLDTRAQVLRGVTSCGSASLRVNDLELPIGRGASGVAALEQQPVWTSNVHTDAALRLPAHVGVRLAREELTAILAVPLLAQGGQVFGSLSVLYREPRTFARADVELLSAFGAQASVALENAGAFDRLALQATHNAALQGFGRRLLEAATEAEVVDDAVNTTHQLLHADSVALFVSSGGHPRLAAGLGWWRDAAEIDTAGIGAFAGSALAREETIEVEDLTLAPRFSITNDLEKQGVRSVIMARLDGQGQPLGVLMSCNRTPRRFTDEETRVLTSLVHQIAVALDRARVYAELRNNLHRLQETQAQLMQADKLKALGTLLSGMAHELNNPLSTIHLSVELLRRKGFLDPSLTARVEIIGTACARASRIIRDLLVFARRDPPERRRVDLREVIESTLNLQAPQLELNKIRLVTSLEPAAPIWADFNQLQQVFLNLFSNAIHAMKTARGHGTLTVRSVPRGSEVLVEVEDDGPGIPSEHLGRIFDPFFTTKAAGSGTGLGLSLAIGVVEAHGGRMHAENLRGTGARFSVYLPIGDEAEAAPAEAPAHPLPAVAAADVLVVEDEDSLRGLLTEVIHGLGHQVVEATTGEEALARLQREWAYDLVMLDLRLPDVDGQVVWQRALASHPGLANRFVFMTGDIMSAETQGFLDDTGRPFLIKPFTMEQVGRVVSEVLAARS